MPGQRTRASPAAYAASQPLFDALRTGCDQLSQQKVNLAQSRDIVQQIHVKLTDTSNIDAEEQHQRYIDGIIKAWRAATDTYTEIFDQLTAVTAAEKTEGRPAMKGHATFRALAETARLAQRASREYQIAEDSKQQTQETESEESSSGGESETEDVAVNANGKRTAPVSDVSPVQPKKVQKLNDDAPPARKALWLPGAEKPNVPYSTLGSSEKKKWKAEKARQKRVEKREKRQAKKQAPKAAAAAPVNASTTTVLPTTQKVEYEDVSAEVEARLKTKAEKKKAKKEAKKRHRESGDSVPGNDPAENRETKRSKGIDGTATAAPTTAEPLAQKRLFVVDTVGAEPGGKAKKRKKGVA